MTIHASNYVNGFNTIVRVDLLLSTIQLLSNFFHMYSSSPAARDGVPQVSLIPYITILL